MVKVSKSADNTRQDVKDAFVLPAVWTSSTIEHVRDLLRWDSDCGGSIPAAYQKKNAPEKLQRGVSKPIKAPKSTSRSKVAREARGEECSGVTDSARVTFAVEVVNQVLQRLTEPTNVVQQSPKIAETTQPQQSTDLGKSRIPPSTHLRPTSGNRTVVPGDKLASTKHAKINNSTLFATESAPVAVVECGHIAYAYLHNHAVAFKDRKSGDWNLESGMLVLGGRLVSLRMIDAAVRELKQLKLHLQWRLDCVASRTSKPTADKGRRHEASEESETLASLLSFEACDAKHSGLRYVINFQTLVLRLIAATHNLDLIRHVLRKLELSCKSSPINLLLALAERPDCRDRAAQQLEGLAQLLVSMCASKSTTNASPRPDSTMADPVAYFKMQVLALQARTMWMALAKHSGYPVHEILRPFTKFLAVFMKTCTYTATASYAVARIAYRSVMQRVKILPNPHLKNNESDAICCQELMLRMSQMAEAAGEWNEAVQYLSIETYETVANFPMSLLVSSQIRTSSINIRHSIALKNSGMLNSNLEAALAFIQRTMLTIIIPCRQVTAELVALQLAILQTDEVFNLPNNAGHSTHTTTIIESSENVLTSIVKYTHKCFQEIDKPSTNGNSIEASGSVKLLFDGVHSSVEGVASWYLKQISNGIANFSAMDALLQECKQLLASAHLQWSEAELARKHFAAVQLSHVYWIWFCKNKNNSALGDQVIVALQRSCEYLRGVPTVDKASGGLPAKLLKFGMILASHGKHNEAQAVFLEAVCCCISVGIPEHVPVSERRPNAALTSPSNDNLAHLKLALERLLHLEGRAHLGLPEGLTFYNNQNLSRGRRQLLLECQLDVLCEGTQSKCLSLAAKVTSTPLCKALLALYDEDKFILDRARVILRCLQLNSEESRHESRELLDVGEALVKCWPMDTTIWIEDAKILAQHLYASLVVTTKLGKPSLNTQMIAGALSIWTELIENSTLWNILNSSDIQTWLQQLSSLSASCAVEEQDDLHLTCLGLSLRIVKRSDDANIHTTITLRISMARKLLTLGYVEEAGVQLHKAKAEIGDHDIDKQAFIAFELVQAEYYLALGTIAKSHEHLQIASRHSGSNGISLGHGHLSSEEQRLTSFLLDADLMHTYARILQSAGHDDQALHQNLLEVSLLQKLWKFVNPGKALPQKPSLSKENQSSSDVVALTNRLESVTMNEAVHGSEESAATSRLSNRLSWKLAERLLKGSLDLSLLFVHRGMFQEASHQFEEMEQLANVAGLLPILAVIRTQMGDFFNRSRSLSKGTELLEKAREAYKALSTSFELALHHCLFGHLHYIQQQWIPELEKYDQAEQILCDLQKASQWRKALSYDQPALASSRGTTGLVSRAEKRLASSRPQPKIKASPVVSKPERSTDLVFPKMVATETEIACRKVQSLLAQGDVEAASKLIPSTDPSYDNVELRMRNRNARGKVFLMKGLKQLSSHSIFNMLSESTISYPSIIVQVPQQPLKDPDVSNRNHSSKRSKKAAPSHQAAPESSSIPVDLSQHFIHAIGQTHEVTSTSVTRLSNSTLSQQCQVFVTAGLLVSYVLPSTLLQAPQPSAIAYANDLPRSIASVRERASSDMTAMKPTSTKSAIMSEQQLIQAGRQHIALSDFQNGLIDQIPSTWNVLSISLDDAREHLVLVRVQAHQSPFIVRLPLVRQNAEDLEEDKFSFEEAQAELEDIISSSDNTVHTARDNPEMLRAKGAKTQWWSDREALDDRLRDLLLNIENLWLGGFRGIFSSHQPRPKLLGRLRESFELILERHLPSRRQNRKQSEVSNQVKLDLNVFELCVGLERMCHDDNEFDEALTDLLYYVVDILQFNGECNAYDELDFDLMIVEMRDALKSYHEAADLEIPNPPKRHTILILDKQLHAFPWESLPCLEGHSISRLSSFYDLHERIQYIRTQNVQSNNVASDCKEPEGIRVAALNGSFFLNTSGDLSKTQSRFETSLSKLGKSWSTLIDTAPSESDFITALTPRQLRLPTEDRANSDGDSGHDQAISTAEATPENNIFLYFGHGSGAQYIRSRCIKRLSASSTKAGSTSPPHETSARGQGTAVRPRQHIPTCNTALLFGCSSASLRVPGEFNVYGTPINYMIAGAPAVLGSLWDVTDGDCDAFAAEVLHEWGVLPYGTCNTEAGSGPQSKGGVKSKRGADVRKSQRGRDGTNGSAKAEEEAKPAGRYGSLSLGEAAAKGRKKCYLKYLNGAAMVVYGVPVFVDRG